MEVSHLYLYIKILLFLLSYYWISPSTSLFFCIFSFSSLVHKTTRLKRILRWNTFSWLFLGVCVFSFFLSSSCPEPHSSEEKTIFRRCLWTQKTSAACENKSEKNTFWENNSIVYITREERKYSIYFHIDGGGVFLFQKRNNTFKLQRMNLKRSWQQGQSTLYSTS